MEWQHQLTTTGPRANVSIQMLMLLHTAQCKQLQTSMSPSVSSPVLVDRHSFIVRNLVLDGRQCRISCLSAMEQVSLATTQSLESEPLSGKAEHAIRDMLGSIRCRSSQESRALGSHKFCPVCRTIVYASKVFGMPQKQRVQRVSVLLTVLNPRDPRTPRYTSSRH